MPIVLKEEVGQQVPEGTHLAVCYRIAAVGTQPDSGFGAKRKIIIFWELPHERIMVDSVEKPMGISKIYSLGSSGGMNKKSALRQDLAAWRGRDFTAEELQGFELKAILGKGCQVIVQHNEEGRAKVDRVAGVPKGTTLPPPVNPVVEYSIDQGKDAVYAKLPEWVRNMCDACLEWTQPEPEAKPAPTETAEPQPDDVPF